MASEPLKSKLVALNGSFYLWPARDPRATYTVLWYHIVETDSCLKVDILLPGVLDIPAISFTNFDFDNASGLPCAPLSLVLLLKLQAWVHHGESPDVRYRIKQPTDAQDIKELLQVARTRRLKPRTESFLPNSFISLAESRVEKFVEQYPRTRVEWVAVGFVVPEENRRSEQARMRFTANVVTRSGRVGR